METIATMLFLSSLIFLEIGFFSSDLSLFWLRTGRSEEKSTAIYGVVLIVSICFNSVFSTKSSSDIYLYSFVIIMLSIVMSLVLLLFRYSANDPNSHYKFAGILLVVCIFVFLPFHYVPSRFMVFAKSNLTFRQSIITEDDIDRLVEKYNNAAFFDQQTIAADPIFRELLERHLIE